MISWRLWISYLTSLSFCWLCFLGSKEGHITPIRLLAGFGETLLYNRCCEVKYFFFSESVVSHPGLEHICVAEDGSEFLPLLLIPFRF